MVFHWSLSDSKTPHQLTLVWKTLKGEKRDKELVWFGLVQFHHISTIVGYLMPDHLYTYILNIYMICKHIF